MTDAIIKTVSSTGCDQSATMPTGECSSRCAVSERNGWLYTLRVLPRPCRPTMSACAPACSSNIDPLPPTRIGTFRLAEPIGTSTLMKRSRGRSVSRVQQRAQYSRSRQSRTGIETDAGRAVLLRRVASQRQVICQRTGASTRRGSQANVHRTLRVVLSTQRSRMRSSVACASFPSPSVHSPET